MKLLFNSINFWLTPGIERTQSDVGEFPGMYQMATIGAARDCTVPLTYSSPFADGQIVCAKAYETVELPQG